MNRLKIDLIAIYSLLLSGIFTGGITSIFGLVYAYVRRSRVRGTPEEADYSDSIKVFWMLTLILVLPLMIIFLLCVVPFILAFILAIFLN